MGILDKIKYANFKNRCIFIDYPIHSEPRYGHGKPPHSLLNQIINRERVLYSKRLLEMLQFRDYYKNIEIKGKTKNEPYWINGWLPGFDSISLYSQIAINKPSRYVEIGSGNSTKFCRRAINDHSLNTKIISIDPHPRDEINEICDKVIRSPLEDINLDLFYELGKNDIVFIDNSHRIFMNSDATTVFLDILPNLKSGVIVAFHDILLPYDYPPSLKKHFYSEQYVLAAYLLADQSNRYKIHLPNTFISLDPELSKILQPLWSMKSLKGIETNGSLFWLKIFHSE